MVNKTKNIQDANMQAVIEARIEAIREAHANNLIEGLDMGTDVFEAMLERARHPISNEEFTRREKALWVAECQQAAQECRIKDEFF